MPHCWPQRQQCVGTILSGTAPVSARSPSIRLRCGPQTFARTSSDLGSVAMAFPEPPLRDGDHRAPAGGADALIVVGPEFVSIAELSFDLDQVLDLQQRRVLRVAARALRHPFLRRHVFVEADAELRGALEDVEELPARTVERGAG